MARGEYGPALVGNGRPELPTQTAFYRSYAVVFRERLGELDAAIQQADQDYAATYKTNWGAGATPGEPGLDQSIFVFRYWLPFVKEWNATRDRLLAQLLAGQIDRNDRGPALWLAYSAQRFNELKQSAGASWGLSTNAPTVVIHGTVEQPPAPSAPPPSKTPSKLASVVSGGLAIGFLGALGYTIYGMVQQHRADKKEWAREKRIMSSWSSAKHDQWADSGLTVDAFNDWLKTGRGMSVSEWLRATPEKG